MTIESDRLAWERAAIAWGQEKLAAVIGRAVRRLPDGQAALSIRHLLDDEELALVALLLYDARVISDLGGRAAAVEQTAQEIRAAGARAVASFAAPVYPVPPDDAFAVEPKDAIQYFRNLAPGTVLPKGFEAKHRRTAFSLAVTTDETLLKRVHEVLLQKLQTGERKAEAWDFKQTMDDLGLSTRNPQYAEMVLRTNAMDAYNDGYERQVRDDPAIRDEFPYWEYLGIDDDRMGEDHRVNLTGGVNGTAYYPADRTFDEVRGDRPFNCRCGQRWVHTSEAEAEGLPVGGAE